MSECADHKIQMMTIDGLHLPKDRKLRPRRAIPGLDDAYAVTQDGRVYSVSTTSSGTPISGRASGFRTATASPLWTWWPPLP
ncbi:hypothetical protein A6B35_30505 (plasmid) [Mesorhizobium amorphae CCNWGS0123]|nr:hypothetical protein A6B35_30505 [Mesorhizobium amorphae CCNWGS0123]